MLTPIDIVAESVSRNVKRHSEIMQALKAGEISEDAIRLHERISNMDRLVRVRSQLTGNACIAYQAPLKYKTAEEVRNYGVYIAGMALDLKLKLTWMGRKIPGGWVDPLLPETIDLLNSLPIIED